MTTVVNILEVSSAFSSGFLFHKMWVNANQKNEERRKKKAYLAYNATRKRIALLEHRTGTGFSNETIEWVLKQKVIVPRFGIEPECVLCGGYASDHFSSSNLPIGLKKRLCAIHLKSVRATW